MDHSNPIKKLAKIGLNWLQNIQVAFARLLGLVDFPVPANSSMRKTSSKKVKHYYVSGIQSAVPIITSALREGVSFTSGTRILDFGCGVGRQLLHFTRNLPGPDYYGCDIDDTSIAFVNKAYPRVDAYTSNFNPPLKYDDAFFDMVYSVSIFSHLNMEDLGTWLSELGRITRPGGYCFLTTEGETAIAPLAPIFGHDKETLIGELRDKGYLYKEYDYLHKSVEKQNTLKITSLVVGIEGSYGNTALSTDYIRTHWNTDQFEVVDILEGIIDFRQDLVILRRK